MKNSIKIGVAALTLSLGLSTSVDAFCAANKSDKEQTWYVAKDKDKMIAFLSDVLADESIRPDLGDRRKAVKEGMKTFFKEKSITKAKNAADVKAGQKAAANIPVKKALLEGNIPVGSVIQLSEVIGSKLAQKMIKFKDGVKWGEKIKPGTQACWNKDKMVKDLSFVKKADQAVFFLVLERQDDKKSFRIVLADNIRIDSGIANNGTAAYVFSNDGQRLRKTIPVDKNAKPVKDLPIKYGIL